MKREEPFDINSIIAKLSNSDLEKAIQNAQRLRDATSKSQRPPAITEKQPKRQIKLPSLPKIEAPKITMPSFPRPELPNIKAPSLPSLPRVDITMPDIATPSRRAAIGAAGALAALSLAFAGRDHHRIDITTPPGIERTKEDALNLIRRVHLPSRQQKKPEGPTGISKLIPREQQPQATVKTEKPASPLIIKPEAAAPPKPPEPKASTQRQEVKPPEKWTPRENSLEDDNGLIKISVSKKPGILDLSYKDAKSGEWKLYNNLVPVAYVVDTTTGKLKPLNAEIDNATPTRSVTVNEKGEKVLNYSYRMSRGVILDMNVSLENGKKEVLTTIAVNSNSTPVYKVFVGNWLGVDTGIQTVQTTDASLTPSDLPQPNDGYDMLGSFREIPTLSRSMTLKGKGPNQHIRLVGNYDEYIVKMMGERRDKVFNRNQENIRNATTPGKPWMEAAALQMELKSGAPITRPITYGFGID
jgi:hypothetical protein